MAQRDNTRHSTAPVSGAEIHLGQGLSRFPPPPISNPRRPGAMKNTLRRTGKSQISDMLRHKGSRRDGHRARGSDSDEPESQIVKYDAEGVADFTKYGRKYLKSVFRDCRSVVALACTVDGMHMRCSGTVVDHVDKETWILTSASLVRKPGTQFEAYQPCDVHIKVVLYDEQTVEGSLAMCNLHYNIAIVTIKSPGSRINLPAVELNDLPECYSLQPRPVVALGRDIYSKGFLVRHGKLVRTNCVLDCKELLVCTCDISQDFIGGPVMDSDKRFLGIIFFYDETTPFLPVEITVRCLEYFKNLKTLPCLHIRGHALHTLNFDVLESICCKFANLPSGILVEKICVEKFGGIEVGDIISELDGVTLYSVAQFTAMFLDKMEVAMNTQNIVTLQAVVRRPTDQTTFVAELNVPEIASHECDESFENRWYLWEQPQYDEQISCSE